MNEKKLSLKFLPRKLRNALMKFQKAGIRYGIKTNGRCLVGDEMGLGKTLQAIGIAYYFKASWPLLIIVPSSMRFSWVNELEEWLPDIQPGDINIVKSAACISSMIDSPINILGYGLLSQQRLRAKSIGQVIVESNFGVVIIDESHYMKNTKSIRTKEILKSVRKIPHVILLSGTPSLSCPVELYPQISLISPGVFGNYDNYVKRFCNAHFITERARGGRLFHKYDVSGASNLDDLHELLVKHVMIRRLKKDVLTQLPAKRRQKIMFEIGINSSYKKEMEKCYSDLKKMLNQIKSDQYDQDKLITNSDYRFSFMQLFTSTALAKAGPVQQYINDMLDCMENKFIVFCYHLTMIQAVRQTLAHRNIKHICITGEVNSMQRGLDAELFQTDPTVRVAVLSIQAASTGLTLTAADHVIFAELHYTPGVLIQAEDRCHRIGQMNAVQIHYLIAMQSIDEMLWSALQRKIAVTSVTLNGKVSSLHVDSEDFGKSELLSAVEAWKPVTMCLSQKINNLFEEKPDHKDIRELLSQSGKKRKKRKKRWKPSHDMPDNDDDNDDDDDFKPVRKKRKASKQPKGAKLLSEVVDLTSDGEENTCSEASVEPCSKSSVEQVAVSTNTVSEIKTVDDNCLREDDCDIVCIDTEKPNTAVSTNSETEIKTDSCSRKDDCDIVCVDIKTPSLLKNAEVSSNTETDIKADKGSCLRKDDRAVLCVDRETPSSSKNPAVFSNMETEIKAVKDSCSRKDDCGIYVDTEAPSLSKNTAVSTNPGTGIKADNCSRKDDWDIFCVDTNSAKTSVLSQVKNSSASHEVKDLLPDDFTKTKTNCSNQAESNYNPLHINKNLSTACEATTDSVASHCEATESVVASQAVFTAKPIELMDKESTTQCTESVEWNCAVCTFSNDPLFSSCQMCGKKNNENINQTINKQPTDETIKLDMWNCKACTFSNDLSFSSCQMCDTEKMGSSSQKSENMKTSGNDQETHDYSLTGYNSDVNVASSSYVLSDTVSVLDSDDDNDDECMVGLSIDQKTASDSLQVSDGSNGIDDSDGNASCIELFSSPDTDDVSEDTQAQLVEREGFVEDFSDDEECLSSIIKSNTSLSLHTSGVIDLDGDDDDDEFNDVLLEISDSKLSTTTTTTTTTTECASTVTTVSSIQSEKTTTIDGILKDFNASNDSFAGALEELECESEKSSDEEELQDDNVESLKRIELRYCISPYTQRIFLYNQEHDFLKMHFNVDDISMNIIDKLPPLLQHEENLRQLVTFVRRWKNLGPVQQNLVRKRGQIFHDPTAYYKESYDEIYGGKKTYKRFVSKDEHFTRIQEAAESSGGKVIQLKPRDSSKAASKKKSCSEKPSDKSKQTDSEKQQQQTPENDAPKEIYQAVDAKGCPLCLHCANRVKGLRAGTWEARYCSQKCMENDKIRSSTRYYGAREQLFEVERGICQLCGVDAHTLFVQVNAAKLDNRKAVLEGTPFQKLPVAVLNKMLKQPKEGQEKGTSQDVDVKNQFWEADHVVAVAEGGGQCGLENYRTLCTPCHRVVTKKLRGRLAQRKRASQKGKCVTDYFSASQKTKTTQRE